VAKQKPKTEQPGTDPKQLLQLIHARNDRESATSLFKFLEHVQIDCRPTPMPFGQVAEWWQKERDQWVVPAFEYVAGIRPLYTGPRNFWLGYSKGQDKTSYIGRNLSWLIAYSPRPLRAVCCASDKEQASVIYDAMVREAALNPWYAKRLTFKRDQVEGNDNGARVEILSSDAAGSHGRTPDLVICDEVTHWQSKELYDALTTALAKRGDHAISVIMTNAGFIGTWQWDIRNTAERLNGVDWFFKEQAPGTRLASWMTEAAINRAKETVTRSEGIRLFENTWQDPTENKELLVSPNDVVACIGEPQSPPPSARVVIGVDYGGTHDRTALCVVWWDGKKVHVIRLDCWQGSKDNEIQVDAVESWIRNRLAEYPRATVVFDRYQMLSVIQKLEREGRNVLRFEYRGGKNNFALAKTLRTLLQNHKIVFSETAGLCGGTTFASELKKLVIKPMVYGFRFDHSSTEFDDRSVAVGQAAMEALGGPPPPPPSRSPKPTEPASKSKSNLRSAFSNERFRDRGFFGLR